MSYTRFAIYYLPPGGPLAGFGAAWLGWDVATGRPAGQPRVAGLAAVTGAPRKYGFHGTLKPPFRLAPGKTAQALKDAVAAMAAGLEPGRCDGLEPGRLGRFLALVPRGDAAGLARVAAACVADLDTFRAPPDAAELERRRKVGLSPGQEALLQRWGYPHVMEAFRFHMTLTGRLPPEDIDGWMTTVRTYLPPLPAPFVLNAVALVGERPDGFFELIQRYTLSG